MPLGCLRKPMLQQRLDRMRRGGVKGRRRLVEQEDDTHVREDSTPVFLAILASAHLYFS